ncbi:MAG: hypothetical protein IJO57_05435 [Bacilli bacterium]|nr:hypothetical protein [Bacilli bacterium]
MKKKLFIIIGIALPIFIILYFWYADCWTAMRINWKISMPYMSLYREIYHKDSGPSFFGDGTRYHVYSYKNEKHIENMFDWQTEEKETEIRSTYSEFIREELDRIEVPDKERPEYLKCKYWYKKDLDDEMVICWNEDNKKLYVIELFI